MLDSDTKATQTQALFWMSTSNSSFRIPWNKLNIWVQSFTSLNMMTTSSDFINRPNKVFVFFTFPPPPLAPAGPRSLFRKAFRKSLIILWPVLWGSPYPGWLSVGLTSRGRPQTQPYNHMITFFQNIQLKSATAVFRFILPRSEEWKRGPELWLYCDGILYIFKKISILDCNHLSWSVFLNRFFSHFLSPLRVRLQRTKYDGHIYFDTFPRNEDPVPGFSWPRGQVPTKMPGDASRCQPSGTGRL